MKSLLHWVVCHTVSLVLLLFILVAVYFRGPIFNIWPDPEPVAESRPETVISSAAEPLSEPAIDTVKPISATVTIPPAMEQPAEETAVDVEPVSEAPADQLKPALETLAGPPAMEQPAEETAVDVEPVSEEPAGKLKPAAGTAADPVVHDVEAVPVVEPSSRDSLPTGQLPREIAAQSTGQVIENPVIENPVVMQKDSPESLQEQERYQFRPPELQPEEDAGIQEDLMQQARKAYWNDDLEKARTLYQAYINLNPENPDGYGELGNLLSTQGNLNSAAHMYRKAAELLEQQGKSEQAEQLKEVLSSIEVIQNMPE